MDFELLGIEHISLIKPQWEKLRQVHITDAVSFRHIHEGLTFEKRCEKFYSKEQDHLRIEAVLENTRPLAYCISTADGSSGEIESLFVDDVQRGKNLGGQLVESAVAWLKSKGCSQIRVGVAEGYEIVFGFYSRHGFYPRLTYLELKE